ncbi:MAG TPA: 2-phospho-L-lactate transferase CofD family protein, partial [Patescibacteria group bacterium]|nr:2-phospho-L-lactate transferase CofD family protein [Patescibacteria group bacterium]
LFFIIIGPGNLYCSILPNLIVPGIPEALRKSKAKIIFNCNLVNKKGHTEKFSLDDYVDVVNEFIGQKRINYVTYNTKTPSKKLISKYENKKELLIRFNKEANTKRNFRIVQGDFLSREKINKHHADVLPVVRSFIRHDSIKLAKILMKIIKNKEHGRTIKK